MIRPLVLGLVVAWSCVATSARADDTELWLNPRASTELRNGLGLELETAQRFRAEPRQDTVYFRLWVHKQGSSGLKYSAGAEQRFNGPDERETRLLQQVSYGWGPVDLRTRVEQRDVSSDDRWGLRARQRVGTTIPLTDDETGWSIAVNAEAFVTARSTSVDGDTGLTGLRTFVGLERPVGRAELSVGYLRQQDIRPGRDRVAHAPFLGLNLTF
ncbi:DUF2490 domain-containing protein [Brevundimonas sp. TWP1-2-1b1]|uniref:DUF2490 domain-containing protein n=1 Tax=unclassified Brevundimonas TaxID=2622653 RepID=UPI003CF6F220